jgi:uncharacterized membrane protein
MFLAIAIITLVFIYIVTMVVKLVFALKKVKKLPPRQFYLLILNSFTVVIIIIFVLFGWMLPFNTYDIF